MTTNKDHTAMAFLLGAAMGGMTAILLAPRSGREIRRRLQETAENIYEQSEEKVRSASSEIRDRAVDVAGTVKHQVDGATHLARGQIDAVKEAADEAKEAYRKERRRQSARG